MLPQQYLDGSCKDIVKFLPAVAEILRGLLNRIDVDNHRLHLPADIIGGQGGEAVAGVALDVQPASLFHQGIGAHFWGLAGKEESGVHLKERGRPVQHPHRDVVLPLLVAAVILDTHPQLHRNVLQAHLQHLAQLFNAPGNLCNLLIHPQIHSLRICFSHCSIFLQRVPEAVFLGDGQFADSFPTPAGVPPVSRPNRPLWGLNLVERR